MKGWEKRTKRWKEKKSQEKGKAQGKKRKNKEMGKKERKRIIKEKQKNERRERKERERTEKKKKKEQRGGERKKILFTYNSKEKKPQKTIFKPKVAKELLYTHRNKEFFFKMEHAITFFSNVQTATRIRRKTV